MPAAPFSANGLRRILNDGQTVLAGKGHHSIHIDWLAIQVNWDDGASLRRHFADRVIKINQPGRRINVAEYRNR